ncbi:GRIPAP1 [Bugula neritina]|uniref:GRIPAP1 n=1 Tax=Bugula neritina TaxID=10212 RepID=A0A7J7J1L6_BUGNE|nr:GRIPAP1 [Bugula neritina]
MGSNSTLSEEEFHRLQLQLIELRTENYQLTDKCKKHENELSSLNIQYVNLDKEFQRASKAVNKSKKAKEFELLIQENESFQRKLQSQEEDFRIQNETLMQELGTLISKNEELEKAVINQDAVDSPSKPTPLEEDTSELKEEVTRLRAENTALQTNIGEIKTKFENELKAAAFCCGRSRHYRVRSQCRDSFCYVTTCSGDKSDTVSLTNLIQESELLSQFNDLKLSLDTEKAENKLLHDRISELKSSSSADAADQLRDKLKKKQESFVTLQNEKEKLYSETSSKITFLEEARQRDIKSFHLQIDKLNEDLKAAKEESSILRGQHEQNVLELESNIKALKSKVSETNLRNLEQAQQDVQRLTEESHVLNQRVSTLQTELTASTNQIAKKDTTLANQHQQINELQAQLDNTQVQLKEKSQAAEKRKKLLDELAIKSQEDSDGYKTKLNQLDASYKQELDNLKSKHKSEYTELSCLLDSEKIKVSQLEKLKPELDSMTERFKSLEETKNWLQRSLQDTETELEKTSESLKAELEETKAAHSQSLSDMEANHTQSLQALEEQLSQKLEEIARVSSEKEALNQKVADNVQDMKLHEKKGASLMRDLKRQLAQERKRGDRLEQRIQELSSSESKVRQPSVEPFFLPIDAERSSIRADDASSVSSWSGTNNFSNLGNSSFTRDTSGTSLRESSISSHPEVTTSQSEHDLSSLLILVESLQKEKSMLSERVSMLEQGNSAMAEDYSRSNLS